jgi:D-aspartate ligase
VRITRKSRHETAGVPAVVVGGSLNALGVVRSLTRGGVPVLVLERTRRCPGRWSRHARFVQVPSVEGRSLVDALRSLADRIRQRPVLILTDDRAVEAVSEQRDELEPHYRIQLPPRDMVPVLADKRLFQQFAEKGGLPVPRSIIVNDRSEVPLLARLTPPMVIKPANKALVLGTENERVVRADTLDHAREVAERMVGPAQGLLAQEWIDGPDTDIHFAFFVCDARSRLVSYFLGRKLVCEPPRIGITAVCTRADDPTGELEGVVRRYAMLSGYAGIGGLELKRERGSRRFVIVEPTVGRTDWQEEIATLSGVNIPLAAYRTALGQPVQPVQPAPRASAPVAWRSSREHAPPPGELPAGSRLVDGYFRPTDPFPGLYYYGFERFAVRLWHLVSQPGKWMERAARLGDRHD